MNQNASLFVRDVGPVFVVIAFIGLFLLLLLSISEYSPIRDLKSEILEARCLRYGGIPILVRIPVGFWGSLGSMDCRFPPS